MKSSEARKIDESIKKQMDHHLKDVSEKGQRILLQILQQEKKRRERMKKRS